MFGTFSRKRAPTIVTDNKHLRKLVLHHLDRHGVYCDLNHLDVSRVEDFSGIFANTRFDGDISRWDVSRATCMQELFASCPFDGDISAWDVSRVTDMDRMFFNSAFQDDISAWDVSRVTTMQSMFAQSRFNRDISHWNVAKVTRMNAMFMSSAFSGNLSEWDVQSVVDMSMMFHDSMFKGDISKWELNALKHATHIFDSAYFESDIPAFKISALVSGASMVSAAFRGRMSNAFNDYASVRKMFPNTTSTLNYLAFTFKAVGPSPVHIDYALQHDECPDWFTPELFGWVKAEQSMCLELGMNANGVRDIVTNDFLQGGANSQRADAITFEFEAARVAA